MENLNQNPIFNFEIILLNKYNYENFKIIVCDYLTKVFFKLWIVENYLHFICIGIFLKKVSFSIFRYITKIGRWLPVRNCTLILNFNLNFNNFIIYIISNMPILWFQT